MCCCSCSSRKCEPEPVKIIRNVSRAHCISVEEEVARTSGEDDNARAPPSGAAVASRGGPMPDWTANAAWSVKASDLHDNMMQVFLCHLEGRLNIYVGMYFYICLCSCICKSLFVWFINSVTWFRHNSKNWTAVSYDNSVPFFFFFTLFYNLNYDFIIISLISDFAIVMICL